MFRSARCSTSACRSRRDCGLSLTRTAPPGVCASWAGSDIESGTAPDWNGDIEGGRINCSRCSQSCSQSVPRFRQMLSTCSLCSPFPRLALLAQFSVFPLLQPGNTGNNGNSIEIESVAHRARWNTRGTPGNDISGEADTEPWRCLPGLRLNATRNTG